MPQLLFGIGLVVAGLVLGSIIITIVSWNGQRGSSSPKTIAYAASKGAIKAATQTIARTYAERNILAYIIAPGVVKTRMSEESAAVLGGVEKLTASLTMGEWVPPEEICATPPDEMTSEVAVPPRRTSRPPLLIVSPSPLPPAEMVRPPMTLDHCAGA